MKQLNVTFEDEEYQKLLNVKGEMFWKEFILERCLVEETEDLI